MADAGVTNAHEPGMTPSEERGRASRGPSAPRHDADRSPPNPVESVVRRFDRWQQRHRVIGFPIAVVKKFGDDEAGNLVSLLAYNAFVGAFPLLLAFTAILGVILQEHPGLHAKLVNSAFAEFPIIGGQIHDQLGVEAFSSTFTSLMIGVAGALVGGCRGFAHTLPPQRPRPPSVLAAHRHGWSAWQSGRHWASASSSCFSGLLRLGRRRRARCSSAPRSAHWVGRFC